ncbi:MAG: hypothetical protein WC821_01115 [archaeon]|jgi:hypothetical protein
MLEYIAQLFQLIQLLAGNPYNFLFLFFLLPGLGLIFYFRNTTYGKNAELDFQAEEFSLTILAAIVISLFILLASVIFAFSPILTIVSALIVIVQVVFQLQVTLVEPFATGLALVGIILFLICYLQVFRYIFLKTIKDGEILKASLKTLLVSIGFGLVNFSLMALLALIVVISQTLLVQGVSIVSLSTLLLVSSYALGIIIIPFSIGGFMMTQHTGYLKLLSNRFWGELSPTWSFYYTITNPIMKIMTGIYFVVDLFPLKEKPKVSFLKDVNVTKKNKRFMWRGNADQ